MATPTDTQTLAQAMFERHVLMLKVCIECRESWPCVGYRAASALALSVALLEAVERLGEVVNTEPWGMGWDLTIDVRAAGRAYREALKSPGSEPGP